MNEPIAFSSTGHGFLLPILPRSALSTRAVSRDNQLVTTGFFERIEFQTLNSSWSLCAQSSLAPWDWSRASSFQAQVEKENQTTTTITKQSVLASLSTPTNSGQNKCEKGQEEGITQVHFDQTNRLVMSVTLFASGFVIGPRGKTIRRIENFSRCKISSCVQEDNDGTKLRLFTFDGDLAAKNTAYRLVATAITKYKTLCDTSQKGQAVEHCHYISGVKFYYYPPPKELNVEKPGIIMMGEIQVVVLDNGSGYIKAGLANERESPMIVPQLIGHSKTRKSISPDHETFVGNRAKQMSGVSFLSSPTTGGIINSFDDQCTLFEDVLLNEMKVDPYDHPLLLSQLPQSNFHQEKRLTAELFETLYIPSLVKKTDSVLSLLDSGFVTGVVVDCGDSISHTSAIYYGSILSNSVQKLQIGGKDVSEYVSRVLMKESGFYPKSFSAREHIRSLKETLLSFKKSFQSRTSSFRRVSAVDYQLPDGQEIHIGREAMPELYKAQEILFNPRIISMDDSGLADMLLNSIAESDPLLHDVLLDHVVLSGGSTQLAGFSKKLEMGLLALCGYHPKTYVSRSPQLSVWRGGMVLANLSTFREMSITRQEYFEEGADRLEHKFV